MKFPLPIALLLSTAPLAGNEEVLPREFPVTRYTSIWEDSPFNREVVAVVETKMQSTFGTHLTLEGLVTDESAGAIAYMRDLKENKILVITGTKSEDSPFYLVDVQKSNNPAETRVTLSDGTETAEIGYPEGVYTKKIETPLPTNPGPAAGSGSRGGNKADPSKSTDSAAPGPPGTAGPSDAPGPPGAAGPMPDSPQAPASDQNGPPFTDSSGPPGTSPPPGNSDSPRRGILLPYSPPATPN